VLVEIQALVAPTALGTPRRAVVGWENSRLAMVLAVLETHGGLKLGQHDIYLNVAGGLRVAEPAADLAVAAALVSSLTGAVLPAGSVYFGEIALSGAIRPVSVSAARLREAAKLGFGSAVMAVGGAESGDGGGLGLKRISHVGELVAEIAATAPRARSGQRARQAEQ
jgi:DNA repair protein RadA/Sms